MTFVATVAGYYYVDGVVGGLLFYPYGGFSGAAPTVSYTITNAELQSSTSTYTATVTKPDPPTAAPLSSTGSSSPYFQYADTSGIPDNPRAFLISDGAQLGSLYVTGKGTYYADSGDGVTLAFRADSCFVGTVPAVTYRIMDPYDQYADSTYTAHVTNPSPPTVSALTSTGSGVATQTATAPQPSCVGSTKLLNGSGQPVSVLTRSDGTYTVDPATGVITFAPARGYSGTGSAVGYRVTDQFGQTAESTYATTVTAPLPPTSSPLTSTGVGPVTQRVTALVPVGGQAELLDGVNPVSSLTVTGEGRYAVNATSGVITFTPEPDYLGTATAVSYTVTDAYDQSATSTYTATVTEPGVPNPAALTSTGAGTAVQSRAVTIPPAGTVTLLDGRTPVTTITVVGQGTYALDPTTGVIHFTPVPGYLGTATAATYAVADSYGQTGSSTYTPTVTMPAPPAAAPLRSSGTVDTTQRQTVTIPVGGAVTLIDGTTPVTTVTNAGEGTYALDSTTGVITFTPLAGYFGSPTPVSYQVSDAYGQSVRSSYAPVVNAAPATTSPTTAPTTTVPATTIPTTTAPATTAPATTDPTATPTPTATSTPAMTGSLPFTGSNVAELTQLAALLVLLGAALTAAGYFRRRPRVNRHR